MVCSEDIFLGGNGNWYSLGLLLIGKILVLVQTKDFGAATIQASGVTGVTKKGKISSLFVLFTHNQSGITLPNRMNVKPRTYVWGTTYTGGRIIWPQ